MATALSTAFQQTVADIAHGHEVARGDRSHLHETERHFLRALLDMRLSDDVCVAHIRITELHPDCRPTGALPLHQAPGGMCAGSVQEGSNRASVYVPLLISVRGGTGHGQVHTTRAVGHRGDLQLVREVLIVWLQYRWRVVHGNRGR